MFHTCRIIICFIVLIASAASAVSGPNKKVRDWHVWCDDALKCTMGTNSDEAGIWAFGFERTAKANSEAVLVLSAGDLKLRKAGSLEIIIDGNQSERITVPVVAGVFRDGIWEFPGVNLDNRITDAMMAGKSMVLILDREDGKKRVKLSLSGVTGSALFMDEAQDRLQRRDALKAKGEGAPRDAVTRVTVLKSSAQLPKPVLAFWKHGTDNCAEGRDENDDLIENFGGISVAVEEGAQLFVLPCGLPGAYNLLSTALIYDEKTQKVRTLPLPWMGQRGPTVTETAYNTNWDDRKSTLTAFYKGRGIGDCGAETTWYWEGGYYSNFEMIEARVKWDCDGKFDEWPLIWPVQ